MGICKMALICVAIICLVGHSADAKPKPKTKDKQGSESADAGEKVTNELADALTRPVTEGDQPSKDKSLPPGLEKKDKTPPGWSKGKKTGWDKGGEKGHQDSVIDTVVKSVFGAGSK